MTRKLRTHLNQALTSVALAMFLASPALAQNEKALKKAFEGKRVILKIDMPATNSGVDVWPERTLPVQFPEVAKAIKSNGIAIRAGEDQMITKVHVVRNHIEFQLGGGGYGTFADMLASPYQTAPILQEEADEERDLRSQIRTTTDSQEKRRLERRLRDLQRQRQADNAAAQARIAEVNLAAEAEIRERRLAAGSRFNIRWKDEVPPDARTPEGVMAALAEYVDFSPLAGPSETSPESSAPGAGALSLRKGMTVEEVEALLGPAKAAKTEETSGLEIMTRTYEDTDHKVVARFASGVLVDFAVTPR